MGDKYILCIAFYMYTGFATEDTFIIVVELIQLIIKLLVLIVIDVVIGIAAGAVQPGVYMNC